MRNHDRQCQTNLKPKPQPRFHLLLTLSPDTKTTCGQEFAKTFGVIGQVLELPTLDVIGQEFAKTFGVIGQVLEVCEANSRGECFREQMQAERNLFEEKFAEQAAGIMKFAETVVEIVAQQAAEMGKRNAETATDQERHVGGAGES